MSSQAVSIFFSYSHKDETLRDELAKHLKTLQRSGLITEWHDRKILPGDEWDRQIKANLNSAQIILILLSPDFIDSDYCHDVEITRAMERHAAGDARVIPVILRPCLWQMTPLGDLQALPKNGTPVIDKSAWPTVDMAFLDVAKGVLEVAKDFSRSAQQPALQPIPVTQPANIPTQQTPKSVQADNTVEMAEAEVVKRAKAISLSTPGPDSSKCVIDYSELSDLLKDGHWKSANRATYELMLGVVGRESGDYLRTDELLNFPCDALRIIDLLWLKYSNERFGFSVQKKIYVECGAMLDGKYPGDKIWHQFGDRVGWRVNRTFSYGNLTFDACAPTGHLPECMVHLWLTSPFVMDENLDLLPLLSRIKTCKV